MSPRIRFRAEVVVATLSLALAVTTLIWHSWIETIFGVDPDHGNGSVEWLIAAALAAVAVAMATLARRERRSILAAESQA